MGEAAPGSLRVGVVFAGAGGIHRFEVELPAGARVGDALASCAGLDRIAALSGLLEAARRGKGWPHDGAVAVGIFGQRCGLDAALADGDRIELTRGLQADPKEVRRRRAAGAGS